MPWDALPESLNSPEKWAGTDNDVWYMRWEILTKGWWAFGPRASEWWAKWRAVPLDLIKLNDGSKWRIETDALSGQRYTSRVQYWSRWHVLLQWPLCLSFHIYWKKEDVPPMNERPDTLGIKKLLFVYGPIHFDADSVYWLLSFFLGGEWK